MYLSLYWPAFILSNVVLVFQEMYNASGFFEVKDKVKDVLISTAWQVGVATVIGSILLGILIGKHVVSSTSAVLLTIVLITNTVYLTFLMFLLGYGLIVFPQRVWELGDYKKRLVRIQNRVAKIYEDMSEASLEISLCVADILKTKESLDRSRSNELEKELEILMMLCPEEFSSSKAGHAAIDEKTGKVTVKTLAFLKSKLQQNKEKYIMSQRKVEELQYTAYFLEDVISSIDSGSGSIKWSFKKESSNSEYIWYTKLQPIVCKFFGIFFGIVSLFSYLGVLGSINGKLLNGSVYNVIVHSNNTSGAGIVIFTMLTLGYLCYVAMFSLFEMKISGIMELVGNNGTWVGNMSFHSRFVARFIAPLCFFYLGFIGENGIIGQSNTAFSKFYQIQVIPVIGNEFNVVFPVLLFCISFLIATNLFNRILVFCKLENFQFGQTFIDDDVLTKGKKKLADKKKMLLRTYERGEFKEHIKQVETKKTNDKVKSNPYYSELENISIDDVGFDQNDIEKSDTDPINSYESSSTHKVDLFGKLKGLFYKN